MEWTSHHQQELHRFLAGFTNPDPQVQASHLQQLTALSHYPYALTAVCDAVCDSSLEASIRLAATTVARQLLQRQTHLSFYTPSLNDSSNDASASLERLVLRLLHAAFQATPSAQPPALQRATMSLLAALVKAMALDRECGALAAAAWSHLISHLHTTTSETMAVMSGPTLGLDETTVYCAVQRCAQAAALLRELCEVALATSRTLREMVGGQADQSLALCTVFSKQLDVLQCVLTSNTGTSLREWACRATPAWMDDVLTAFAACTESGVLPTNVPTALENAASSLGDDGPAAAALRSVSAATNQVHTQIQHVALSCVLDPFVVSERSAMASFDVSALHSLLDSTAPLIGVVMRYLGEATTVEAFPAQCGAFYAAALPSLAVFCVAAERTQRTYEGAGYPDSTHAAVVSCVNYAAQLLSVEHAVGYGSLDASRESPPHTADAHSSAAPPLAHTVYRMLVSAATLPPAVAEQLTERTAHIPDSAADTLVTTVAARRRGQGENAPHAGRSVEENTNSDDGDDGEEEGYAMADAVEAQLPDNGTLRQAVACCADSLSCNTEWLAAVTSLIASPAPHQNGNVLRNACDAEAALFVCNEVVDAALVDSISSANTSTAGFGEMLAAQLALALSYVSPSTTVSLNGEQMTGSPFYLRAQAARFAGRLCTGLMESWRSAVRAGTASQHADALRIAQLSHAALQPAGGLEGLLWTLTQVLQGEVNKAVQLECVQAITTILTASLGSLDVMSRGARKEEKESGSDLEEESLNSSTSSDDGQQNHQRSTGELGQDVCASSAHELMSLFCQSIGLSPMLAAFIQTIEAVTERFSRFQWSVRQSIYHLYSEALPLLWTHAPQQQQNSARDAQPTPVDGTLVRAVTAHTLEALAGHYMSLLADVSGSLFEMASLLSCMADVATAMDAAALDAVVPWILQVAHHVLSLYESYLSQRQSGSGGGGGGAAYSVVDMTDMCMVSLDLISCVCDGLIDRDALLVAQLGSTDAMHSEAMDTRMRALGTVLLSDRSPQHASDATSAVAAPADALPSRCLALLQLCQSLPDHPAHAVGAIPYAKQKSSGSSGGAGDGGHACDTVARASDEFGDVRRACFAILYDCVFVMAYTRSLFQPAPLASASTLSEPSGISNALGRMIFELCLREVLPNDSYTGGDGASPAGCHADRLRLVSTHNAAASDAWLCLGALLSLWDQQWYADQHQRSRRSAEQPVTPLTASPCTSPASLFWAKDGMTEDCSQRHHVQAVVDALLTLLPQKSFAVSSYLKLNMTTALCALAAALASPSCRTEHSTASSLLSFPVLSALFAVASSARIREYAPEAASGDSSGLAEAAQILWSLGRVWRDAVQPLPHDALCAFLRARGKDLAKTMAWLVRCLSAYSAPLPAGGCSFWRLLLDLWRPMAQTVLQAAQAGVVTLTAVQTTALQRLYELSL